MGRFIASLKSSRKLHSSFIILAICFIVLSCCYYVQERVLAKQMANKTENTIIDNMKLIKAMFPEKEFIRQGKYYSAGEREDYFIESIIPGSFVSEGSDELLVVVRMPSEELSHAQGFYNAYMAVFDNSSGKMVSGVKHFSADEGSYHIFDSDGISYIFFAGDVTYQGWSNWHGGLWQAGPEWTMKWPDDMSGKEYEDFWENRAVEIGAYGIKILQRKVLPLKSNGQVIPDYTWEYSKTLLWDKQSGSFKEME